MRKIFINQLSYFISGFVFWLPIAIIIIMFSFVISNFEGIGRKLLFFIQEDYLFPGLGIIVSLLIVYITGIILKLPRIRQSMSSIPVIGPFFASGEIITLDQLMNMNPCIFLFSPTCISYGWILSSERIKLEAGETDFVLINVYYPNVPSLITGQVFTARKETVIRLGNSSKEIIDILLYAFRSPRYLKYLPWEDEPAEEFAIRVETFGSISNIPRYPGQKTII